MLFSKTKVFRSVVVLILAISMIGSLVVLKGFALDAEDSRDSFTISSVAEESPNADANDTMEITDKNAVDADETDTMEITDENAEYANATDVIIVTDKNAVDADETGFIIIDENEVCEDENDVMELAYKNQVAADANDTMEITDENAVAADANDVIEITDENVANSDATDIVEINDEKDDVKNTQKNHVCLPGECPENPIIIGSVEDLEDFATDLEEGNDFYGKYFEIKDDIIILKDNKFFSERLNKNGILFSGKFNGHIESNKGGFIYIYVKEIPQKIFLFEDLGQEAEVHLGVVLLTEEEARVYSFSYS